MFDDSWTRHEFETLIDKDTACRRVYQSAPGVRLLPQLDGPMNSTYRTCVYYYSNSVPSFFFFYFTAGSQQLCARFRL